jgi:hypothetical protein
VHAHQDVAMVAHQLKGQILIYYLDVTPIRIESIWEAVMYWFPVGYALIGLVLHIFSKITLPM